MCGGWGKVVGIERPVLGVCGRCGVRHGGDTEACDCMVRPANAPSNVVVGTRGARFALTSHPHRTPHPPNPPHAPTTRQRTLARTPRPAPAPRVRTQLVHSRLTTQQFGPHHYHARTRRRHRLQRRRRAAAALGLAPTRGERHHSERSRYREAHCMPSMRPTLPSMDGPRRRRPPARSLRQLADLRAGPADVPARAGRPAARSTRACGRR